MTLSIAATDLAALFDGIPALLAMEGVNPAPLALPGLSVWQVTRQAGGLRLHRPGSGAEGPGVPVPVPPASALAVVTPDATLAVPLLAWWSCAGPETPPVIEAADAEAALPQLARLALAALSRQAAATAVLHRALAAARQEAEESREAMVSLIQHSSRSGPPAGLSQALALQPSAAGHAVTTQDGRLAAGQALGLKLEGLACLAVHVREAQVAPAGLLRLRLYGAESGRVFGAWLVPGEALVPGWLVLDLPAPLGPVRETACLDLTAELELGDVLALSLDDRQTAPERALAVRGGPAQERALALRLWTAPFGRRFVVPAYWDAEAIGQALAAPGVPMRLPAQVWEGARFPVGQVDWMALGTEAPRLVASFGPGKQLVIVLPAVPVNGLDLLQAEVAVARGDAGQLEAALWLQPDGMPLALESDLVLDGPEARWSGWRSAGAEGGPLLLPLALPLNAPRSMTVVLVLRHAGQVPGQPLRVEWSDLLGFRDLCPPPVPAPRQPLPAPKPSAPIRPAPPPRAAGPVPVAPPKRPVAATASQPAPSGPSAAIVRLQEYFVTPDGGYRHLDIWLEGVLAGPRSWPVLRFKLALRGEGPVLEFRAREGWPTMFSTWPSAEADSWGPFLLVREGDLAGEAFDRLPQERDRHMLAAMVRLLPDAVARAVREAPQAAAEEALWLRLARRLADAMKVPAG
ncbi:DUF6212 domain-containing protein [Belnapia rosea]|uniref:Uncharacterized protein n=1 Tax=Belnapia rosea TaxID=938405 RepID=A0A1G6QNF1_9PROT|nr:DUF6212 domain-containing protein [Belnapia rosea]SDC93819.1 hypothetical protein SAMN04487779_1003117 [Belnapia rosea]